MSQKPRCITLSPGGDSGSDQLLEPAAPRIARLRATLVPRRPMSSFAIYSKPLRPAREFRLGTSLPQLPIIADESTAQMYIDAFAKRRPRL